MNEAWKETKMTKNLRYFVSVFLVLSAVLLGVLVPGGPIETRSFSHIHPLILGTFNAFLTSLGLLSLLLVYFIIKGKRWAFVASALCGVSYFLVYVLDLGKIFPVSPDPMPQALLIIEILGTVVSLPLIFLPVRIMRQIGDDRNSDRNNGAEAIYSNKNYAIPIILLILIAVGIITFATISAMK
jgi:hypothetical protein